MGRGRARAPAAAAEPGSGSACPDASWLVARDRIAEYVTLLALITGTLAKLGNEVYNLQRPELGELSEAPTAGVVGEHHDAAEAQPGALRAPVDARPRSCARAPASRSKGWSASTSATARRGRPSGRSSRRPPPPRRRRWRSRASSSRACAWTPTRMRANLDAQRGYVLAEPAMLALAARIGKHRAHELVHRAALAGDEAGVTLRGGARGRRGDRGRAAARGAAALLAPERALGAAGATVDAVLDARAGGAMTRAGRLERGVARRRGVASRRASPPPPAGLPRRRRAGAQRAGARAGRRRVRARARGRAAAAPRARARRPRARARAGRGRRDPRRRTPARCCARCSTCTRPRPQIDDARYGDLANVRERALEQRVGNAAGWLNAGRPRREAGRIAFRIALRERLLSLETRDAALRRRAGRAGARASATRRCPTTRTCRRRSRRPPGTGCSRSRTPCCATRSGSPPTSRRPTRSPAGAGGVNGSRFPLDRERLAHLLGFDAPIEHTRDACGQTDGLTEAVWHAATAATNASRFAEDLEVYGSDEFGLLTIGDELCRASALMPQKRNPYALVVIRGAAGTLLGRATGVLATQRTPSGRTDNLLYAYGEVAGAVELATRAVDLAAAVAESLRIDRAACARRAREQLRAGRRRRRGPLPRARPRLPLGVPRGRARGAAKATSRPRAPARRARAARPRPAESRPTSSRPPWTPHTRSPRARSPAAPRPRRWTPCSATRAPRPTAQTARRGAPPRARSRPPRRHSSAAQVAVG